MSEKSEDERESFMERVQGYKRKRRYKRVFGKPEGDDWRVEANWEDAYYGAARAIITGVVEGRYPRAVEGVAGVFLFRHYIEISMKFIILHSRWLKDRHTRAMPDEIAEVKKTHSLKVLWDFVRVEALPKVEDDWKEWDIDFVEACISDFDAVDPGHQGDRFRYHAKSFAGANVHLGHEYLWIDFEQLLENMSHVREVLEAIDLWLYETHGQLEEYESDMASWGPDFDDW